MFLLLEMKKKKNWSYLHNPLFPKRKMKLGDVKAFTGCKLVTDRKREKPRLVW